VRRPCSRPYRGKEVLGIRTEKQDCLASESLASPALRNVPIRSNAAQDRAFAARPGTRSETQETDRR